MKVEKGSKVKVEYEGRLESGEVFDSSSHGDHSHPLEFEVGSGQVIPGFDQAVVGMNIGDEKEITISPDKAYGDVDEKMIRDFPKGMFAGQKEPEEGMEIALATPDGNQIPCKITKITGEKITIDLNHPLAGKTLIFKIKVVSID